MTGLIYKVTLMVNIIVMICLLVNISILEAESVKIPTSDWSKSYGGHGYETGHSGIVTSDGGYIILGSIGHTRDDPGGIYIFKIDEDGLIKWENMIRT